MPTDAAIEHALQITVRRACAAGELGDLTVRRIRYMVEEEMGLEGGFLKEERRGWKERSKRVITVEVDACANTAPSSQLQHDSAESMPVGKGKGEMRKVDESEEAKGKKGRKRRAVDEGGAKKRRRKNRDDDDDDEEVVEDEKNDSACEEEGTDVEEEQDSSPPSKIRYATSTHSPSPEKEQVAASPDDSPPAELKAHDAAPSDVESEMSVLIDEPPKKKGRPRAKKSDSVLLEKKPALKDKKQKKQRKSTTADGPTDPDQEEIKRLQDWLVKCGIRKMWWKKLQPYETSKSKIRHLKEMLAEAGMSGRYSLEKASQIREERELRADLEAVQEGAKIWGRGKENEGSDGNDNGGGRPKRLVAKGLQGLDFLNDDDGEETD